MAEAPVRSSLADAIRKRYLEDGALDKFLDEVDNFEKQAWLTCPHCKKRAQIAVPDDSRKLEALIKLIQETEGKPGTVDADAAGITIIVQRLPWPGDESPEE